MSTAVRIPVSPGLFKFNGGIHIPTNKDMSVQVPLAVARLPKELVLPLQQHIGQIAEAVVKEGDRVLKGQLIAKAPSYVSAPIHAPTSGIVSHIGNKPVPHSSGLEALCLTIEVDGKEEWCERQPIENYTELDPITLRNKVREAGIVGLGGAAFPSSVKLNPSPNSEVELLVINGAECEPYITCDQTLMSERAEQVIGGIQIILHTLGINQCWIGIEDTMPTALKGLNKAIREACEESRIHVKVVPTIYPTGGEKQLIKVLTGKEVPSNGLPAEIGIVCHNPGTAAAMYRAIIKGEPLITRILTVTGNGVKQPRNLDVLFGTPMSHLIAEAGGYTDNVERLVMGGPMMGFSMHTDELPIVKATNCILVGKAGALSDFGADPAPADPCIRCGDCANACPANLLPQQLYWYSKSRQFEQAQEDYNLFDCIECGCCSFVCPSNIPLVQYYRFAKTEIRGAEADKRKADHARERHEFREERMEREQREKAEKLRKKKEELERKKTAAVVEGSAPPGQDAIAAAVARAAARKAKLAEEGKGPKNTEQLSDGQQAQINAADARQGNNDTAATDPKTTAIAKAKAKAAAVAAAKAKAKIDTTEQDKTEALDAKQVAIAAAKAKALEIAKKKAQQEAGTEPGAHLASKTAAIAAAKDRAPAKPSVAGDPKKAAIAAAKAKAQEKSQPTPPCDNEATAKIGVELAPKKAAIEAAKARALAKTRGDPKPHVDHDPKRTAIEAAKERALAKASQPTSDEPKLDPKKAAIQAARERALAKAKENQD